MLAEHRIGALVVTNGDRKIVGIISERDIVRVIGKEGAAALDHTGARGDDAEGQDLQRAPHRQRGHGNHDARAASAICRWKRTAMLDGIISIGDVVKRRIEDVEREADEIRAYIATA